jgi:hypothetical protein
MDVKNGARAVSRKKKLSIWQKGGLGVQAVYADRN